MTHLGLLLSKWFTHGGSQERPDSTGKAPSSLAPKDPSRRRHCSSLLTGCHGVVLGLVVIGGVGKGCCPGPGCPPPKFPAYTFTPNTLTFAPQVVNPSGAASAPQSVILKSTGSKALTISSITVTTGYAQTNDCPATLAIGSTCTIQVSFAPNAVNQISGSLTINGGGFREAALSGTGVPPVNFSPASLDFGTVDPGTTSAPQTLTLTNNQDTTLTITSILTSGNYAQTNTCPASLGAGENCDVQVTFAPTVSGAVPGAVTVVTDALPGSQPAGLSGTGSGSVTSNLSFNPASLTFADQEAGTNSGAQPVTVTNISTTNDLTINAVTSSGANYGETDNCAGQVIPPLGTCTINVTFQPNADLAPASYAGAITVSDSDATSPNVLGLSGNGVAPVTASPQSVSFGTLGPFDASPTKTVTVTNNHGTDEDVSISFPAHFAAANNNCPATLPAGGQCSLALQYDLSLGAFVSPLVVSGSTDGFLSPYVANLSACRTEMSLFPSTLNFGSVPVGEASNPQTLTINNGGSLPFHITDISLSGEDAADFSITTNTCSSVLPVGQSCILKTVLTPSSSATRSAAISITDDAHCSPQLMPLAGGSAAGPFTIAASTTGTAGGTIASDPAGINCATNGLGDGGCTASFTAGSTVTLTATPTSGAPFVGWVGACSGTAPCVLDMSSDKQVLAVFGSNPVVSVALVPVDNGSGSVTSNPGGIDCGSTCQQQYPPETVVELTPAPASGSTFIGWGQACAETGPCRVTVLTSQTVEADFAAPAFGLESSGPTPATIRAGQSATATVTVASRNGFDQPVSFSCSSLPVVAMPPTCSIDNITPPANGSASGTLTITTTAATSATAPPSLGRSRVFYAIWLSLLGVVSLGTGGASRRRNQALILLWVLVFTSLLIQVACGGDSTPSVQNNPGNSGTPAGNYTITVTGTSGSAVSSTQIQLVVQ